MGPIIAREPAANAIREATELDPRLVVQDLTTGGGSGCLCYKYCAAAERLMDEAAEP